MTRALKIYLTLCEDLTPERVEPLRGEVRRHFEQLVVAQRESELVAVDLAELLCVRLEALLARAPKMQPDHRALVVGAARYFVASDDATPDHAACTGLDDDVAVFNHVAAAIGRDDLRIDD